MYRFVIPLILATTATSTDRSYHYEKSAATPAQIRFAIENKYDSTGPGAKTLETAYNTYNTLEEALVGYLDDPDTKLPEQERANAINKLYKNKDYYYGQQFKSYKYPQSNEYYNAAGFESSVFDGRPQSNDVGINLKAKDPFRWQKVQAAKANPLSLAHYTREPSNQFHADPRYTFPYGVNNKQIGDSTSAQETRHGATVYGFYTFVDPAGKTRTVQYLGDDQGFQPITTHV